jgi:cytochrome c oxidase assembly protein subunit 15
MAMPVAAPAAGQAMSPAGAGWVRAWLFSAAALVFAMVIVGGATRLTDSGLSITEWQPIIGIVPPLSEADWQDAFAKYKATPEYERVNPGMSLDAFKVIYWWEWAHRALGRLIGLVFALPFLWFWLRGRLPRGLTPKLLGVLALGGLQGLIGWYMVQSGLVDRVDVSPYRLAVHLTMAIVIFGWLLWLALGLRDPRTPVLLKTVTRNQQGLSLVLLALVLVQIALGGFVAGLKAGLTYNTWPLMDGKVIPDGLGTLEPWYVNFFENVTTVQFTHRTVAYILVALVLWHAWTLARAADDQRVVVSAALLATAVVGQAALGIWMLVTAQGAIPILLGLAHQGGAVVVFATAVWHHHRLVRG